MKEFFSKAKPVWLAGLENEPNTVMGLKAALPSGKLTLNITGFTSYRVFADGKFILYGPARTAGGYARVDEIKLPAGASELYIEIMGYRCYTLSTSNRPSFVEAEITDEAGSVIAATGSHGFTAYHPATHMQKVMRYSRQRHYSEVWDYREGVRFASEEERAETELSSMPTKYLPRRAPMPDLAEKKISSVASRGRFVFDNEREIKKAPYGDKETLTQEGASWGGWPYEEIPFKPFWELQRIDMTPSVDDIPFGQTLNAGEYAVVDFGNVEAGFLEADFTALGSEAADVMIAYNELCDVHKYTIPRMTAVNVLEYLVKGGDRCCLPTAEPYTAKICAIFVKSGSIRLDGFGIRCMRRDPRGFKKVKYDDPVLALIDKACLRSFSHNAVDIYMDCPSRERAGWLCDSYYTSQTEYELTGKTMVEDAFLENFVIRDNDLENRAQAYGRIMPAGMLPMCYPSDMSGSKFIPQWAMWYVIEVDMYLRLRRPDVDPAVFRKTVDGLFDYLRPFENSDGLLEKLEGWQFIEWTAANKWGQDINYPTNFLYAEALECASRICENSFYAKRAEEIRAKTVEKSFNGTFFIDNAVYGEDGVAHNTTNISEACQYYAIRFGRINIDDPRYAALKEAIMTKFMMGRPRELLPEVEPADALMGIYLRLELLSGGTDEERAAVVNEIRDYFGERSAKTGTLWEYREAKGSLDHGFSSFALVCLRRALGLTGN